MLAIGGIMIMPTSETETTSSNVEVEKVSNKKKEEKENKLPINVIINRFNVEQRFAEKRL
ncbi:hypothetical protein [Oceanobacillus senegalensis]|uniref:hypothetical protein n=1 Tax=Oceanobacillus senegalensis TaxID=1936063 RepID=UPI000A3127F2|nr:hypothetical protein [Oceanobacillus senegalensis]